MPNCLQGIECWASELKDMYENKISKETWNFNDQSTDSERTSLVSPRLNSTPILVGKLNASQLKEVKAAYERQGTDEELDIELERLAESFCSKVQFLLIFFSSCDMLLCLII